MGNRLQALASRNERRFFWTVILPIQSILVVSFSAPMYGFNALIEPINRIFSPEYPTNGWPGAIAGGLVLFGGGLGAMAHEKALRIAKTPARLSRALHLLVLGCFCLGALACYLELLWLLLIGFAFPAGLVFSNMYMTGIALLMEWARRFNRAGLQTGVFGMAVGGWAAFYSFVAPQLVERFNIHTVLVMSGAGVCMVGIGSSFLFVHPSSDPSAESAPATARPPLRVRQLFRLPPFFIFFLFFLLFLTPGFGLKIMVQVLSAELFQATGLIASLMAVAFLTAYAVSRLVSGILSEHIALKKMYALFSGVQAGALLAMAVTLPMQAGTVFFTVMLCVVGAMHAAGKCLWPVVILKLYGAESFTSVVRATLPAYGAAGLIGPLTLNWALRGTDVFLATSYWLYAVAAGVLLCVLLFQMLRRVDYRKLAAGHAQGVHFGVLFKDERDRF